MNRKPKYSATIVAAICILLSIRISAQQAAGADSELDELKAAITQLVAQNDIPGVSIAIVDENGPVWIEAIGEANLEDGVAADANTLFRIGSTSKMFVSLSILKLVEEGKLKLDDRLSEWAPEIAYVNEWEDSAPIRIVHLLEHTTGWDDIHLPEYAHNDPAPVTLKQGLDFHPHSRVSRWQPGSRMAYCNSGPPVAAYIVEKVTGQAFEEYVAENFFAPIGMETATYFLTEHVREKGATLYANGNQREDYWHIIMRPSGSINASANDMAKFLSFYLNRGVVNDQQLISHDSLRRMETAMSTNGAKAGLQTGYGLSNYSSTHKNWSYQGHNGGVNGGITDFAYLPEAGIGHVVMINSDDGATFTEISDLIRDYETRNMEFDISHDSKEVSAEHRELEGLYYPINPRQQAGYFLERILGAQRFRFEEGKLGRRAVMGGDNEYYYPVSPDLYVSETTGLVSLARAVDPLEGPVVHADMLVLKPAPTWLIYGQLSVLFAWGFTVVSSVLYFLVWGVRRLRGKIPAGATIRVRLWPLLASVSVIIVALLFAQGMADPFVHLAYPTAVSVGIMGATLLFALFAMLGVHASVKARQESMNRGNYWYSTASSVVHLIVAAYLLSFGVIGLATWT